MCDAEASLLREPEERNSIDHRYAPLAQRGGLLLMAGGGVREEERKVANDIHDMPRFRMNGQKIRRRIVFPTDRPLFLLCLIFFSRSPNARARLLPFFLVCLPVFLNLLSFTSRTYTLRSRKRNSKCTVRRLICKIHLNLTRDHVQRSRDSPRVSHAVPPT